MLTRQQFKTQYWNQCTKGIKRAVHNVIEEHLITGKSIGYIINKYYKSSDAEFRSSMKTLVQTYKELMM